ncbi:hypothetical protein HYH02_014138 [Chlamydomonas schloesseri]|uniref:Clp R domain-containing protein n=1 Tax=Chlamydomonas schloesseri TaxID=2026947 RepID=A0A835VV70_9CHLO|nr:hypothetical protein HYH02_014138 [Chlamydomonas schloesseri]|eukprot:KAG2429100.1 hypothetical protein HYH02_014138 [Chlamydomonas schloesseri]
MTVASAAARPARNLAIPLTVQTAAALRAAREQAVLQSLLFAGPDQLLLGVLAGSQSGTAAACLEAALGGEDCESVREWLNEQCGVTAAKLQGSSWLRPSDVEFSSAAREVLSLAEAGAVAMGSSSVGTYHLLLVLMGAGEEAEAGADQAAPGSSSAPSTSAFASEVPSSGPTGSGQDVGPTRGGDLGLLCSLLDVAGVDKQALQAQLLALAEAGGESLPAQDSRATAAGVVAALKNVYQQQAARAWHERNDDAFRQQARRDVARPHGPDPDDEYE